MPQLQLYLNKEEDKYVKETQRVYDIGSKFDAIKKIIELRSESQTLEELKEMEDGALAPEEIVEE